MTKAILACPFCGGVGRALLRGDRKIQVVCMACGASGGESWEREEAVEKWNRRKGEQ